MDNIRAAWLAIIMLTAAMLGGICGWLSWLGGMNPPNAILSGAGAFGGTVMLIISLFHFITGSKS